MGNWQVHIGDCLEVMEGLPDASFDAVITDIPYGTNEEAEGVSKLNGTAGGDWQKFALDWDKSMPLDWIPLAVRKLRPGGSWFVFCDNKRPGDLWAALRAVDQHPLQNFYWIKSNPPTNPRKNFRSGVETAVFARSPGKILAWNGGGVTENYFRHPIVQRNRVHPTQKPVALMRHLVRLCCNPGFRVLDPFCGSGATGVAALREGCDFVGIDMSAEYVHHARRRLSEVDPFISVSHTAQLFLCEEGV